MLSLVVVDVLHASQLGIGMSSGAVDTRRELRGRDREIENVMARPNGSHLRSGFSTTGARGVRAAIKRQTDAEVTQKAEFWPSCEGGLVLAKP